MNFIQKPQYTWINKKMLKSLYNFKEDESLLNIDVEVPDNF